MNTLNFILSPLTIHLQNLFGQFHSIFNPFLVVANQILTCQNAKNGFRFIEKRFVAGV